MRLIGTPSTPTIIDVCLKEDFENDPHLSPTARRCPHLSIAEHVPDLIGKPIVVVCQKGLKLSQGAAALLRTHGVRATALAGGNMAWRAAGLPLVPAAALPDDGQSTRWVTDHHPRIDHIACAWLIRRFVDPQAQFLLVPPSDGAAVAEKFKATAFGTAGASWIHSDALCTFDAMIAGFGLGTPALKKMARVIRGADANQPGLAPECAGLLALSVGLARAHPEGLMRLEAGVLICDALYQWACDGRSETQEHAA